MGDDGVAPNEGKARNPNLLVMVGLCKVLGQGFCCQMVTHRYQDPHHRR